MPRTSDLRSRTFRSMGTVVSLTVPAAHGLTGPEAKVLELEAATTAVEQVFLAHDRTFSLYRPGSEASAIARGELALAQASDDMRRTHAEALRWRLDTEGAFTPERPDGVLDLAGIVKAQAIMEAGTVLLALGLQDWCLNAGGDVLAHGSPEPGRGEPWRAGVVDPADRGALVSAFPLGPANSRSALATSGTAERGEHIWAAGLARTASSGFRQVSVAAADIVTADVLATAIMAGGRRTLDIATGRWDVDVLAVSNDGGLLATPGFRT
ncbi:FAD:protein FMN transferase [Arthrobacter silvisoli]|uniref:FAD:protein FMN transferase n=1 Tax=Arthrobacter silvisoli TaxID=2291022 RepID=UPI001FE7C544|nr:FAD:protein FMN transferase [Arthrobacter silvisoli]